MVFVLRDLYRSKEKAALAVLLVRRPLRQCPNASRIGSRCLVTPQPLFCVLDSTTVREGSLQQPR